MAIFFENCVFLENVAKSLRYPPPIPPQAQILSPPQGAKLHPPLANQVDPPPKPKSRAEVCLLAFNKQEQTEIILSKREDRASKLQFNSALTHPITLQLTP